MPRSEPAFAGLIRIASPVLYAATVPAVFLLTLFAVIAVERTVGLHTWIRVGDIDAAVALLTAGALVFAPATALLRRADRPGDSLGRRHFRHSALLYAAAVLLAAALLEKYEHRNGLFYAYTAICFLATCLGITVNALTHWLMSRRSRLR